MENGKSSLKKIIFIAYLNWCNEKGSIIRTKVEFGNVKTMFLGFNKKSKVHHSTENQKKQLSIYGNEIQLNYWENI